MIDFHCHMCGEPMSVPSSLAGLIDTCPGCKREVPVPKRGTAATQPKRQTDEGFGKFTGLESALKENMKSKSEGKRRRKKRREKRREEVRRASEDRERKWQAKVNANSKWRCPGCGSAVLRGDPLMLRYYEEVLRSGGMIAGPIGKCQACGAEFPISAAYVG